MNWSHGYNAEEGYTYGYYRELDPNWIDFCSIVKGITPPIMYPNEKLRYLELGCGQGLNLCLIAASNPQIEFIGLDFNPKHIAHAKKIANSAGISNISFIEADFHELAKEWPKELGKFHYIGAHGVLSWISSEISKSFFKCIYHASQAGSLVYVSYNSMPGWISGLAIQHLIRLWQVKESIPNSTIFEIGYQRLKNLVERNIPSVRALPTMRDRVDNLSKLDRAYLVQEYLHDEWRPLWFDQVAEEMSKIKLSYVGTANSADWFLLQMLPSEWQELVKGYSDPVVRETVFDMIINQTFRRDIWVRGGLPLWVVAQRERLLSMKFVLLERPQNTGDGENPFKFRTSLGEVTGKPEVYGPLYDALASGTKTVSELISAPILGSSSGTSEVKRTLADVLQALGLMLNQGHIAIARNRDEKIEKTAKSLNRVILESVFKGAPYRFLIASSIPWIISASDGDMILGHLRQTNPKADAFQLGTLFANHLLSLGRGLVKDGKPVTEAEALKVRSIELAEIFITKTLPLWQRLGVI